MPFGGDQPAGIGAIALLHTLCVVPDEEVRISTRKRHRSKGLASSACPLAIALLVGLVRSIDERREDLDQHVVATKAEGRRIRRYS